MSIASRITSIENHLSNDYVEIARLGADLTNVDKNIENIAEAIREAYSKMPKVLGVGSNLSLTPTLKGGLDIIPKGACEQDSYSGKNKANSVEYHNSISASGVVNRNAGTSYLGIDDYVSITPNTQYVASFEHDIAEAPLFVGYKDINGDFLGERINLYTSRTFTTPSNAYSVFFYLYKNTAFDTIGGWVQLELGSSATSYEPYVGGIPSPNPDYPQSVRVVTGDNDVVVSNKNLVDWGTQSFTTFKDYTGLDIKAGTYTFSALVTSSDTTYQYSRVYFYNTNTNYSTYNDLTRNNRSSFTITLSQVVNRIVLYSAIDYANSNGKTATYENIQLELGSTATSYIPHAEQKVILHLGTNYLAGIGDYKDEIVGKTNDWKIVRKTHKINFKDFTFNLNGEQLANVVRTKAVLSVNANNGSGICNGFLFELQYYTNKEHFYCQAGSIYLFIDKSRLTEITATAVNDYIQANNFYAYYILETPTEEPIADTTLINDLNNMYNAMGYDGQTNITITSNSSNTQMTASVSALKGE